MSNAVSLPLEVPLSQWVQDAKKNPALYQTRQAVEILLHAIGMTPELNKPLILKGGTLMAIAFGSKRVTGDVDFTVTAQHNEFADMFEPMLDEALQRASSVLGYTDLICKVQSCHKEPSKTKFDENTANAPALKLNIGIAQRNTPQAERLAQNQSAHVLSLDLSFKEPVTTSLPLQLEETKLTIQAYTLEEIIAEKLRATLQQVVRNRSRRQDIYDIHWLLENFEITDGQRATIHAALIVKGEARDLPTNASSMDNPEVKERSSRDWASMKIEIGKALPDFEETYAQVNTFYKSLPW